VSAAVRILTLAYFVCKHSISPLECVFGMKVGTEIISDISD